MKEYLKRDLHKTYLVLAKEEEGYEESYETAMLLRNDLERILPLHIQRIDAEVRLCFDISTGRSLRSLFEYQKLNYREMKRIMEQILELTETIREYLLDMDHVLMDPDHIYYKNEEYYVCYCPWEAKDCMEAFRGLMEYFLGKLDYQDQKGVELVYHLYRCCCEDNYSMEQILQEHLGEQSATDDSRRSEAQGEGRDAAWPNGEEPWPEIALESEPRQWVQSERRPENSAAKETTSDKNVKVKQDKSWKREKTRQEKAKRREREKQERESRHEKKVHGDNESHGPAILERLLKFFLKKEEPEKEKPADYLDAWEEINKMQIPEEFFDNSYGAVPESGYAKVAEERAPYGAATTVLSQASPCPGFGLRAMLPGYEDFVISKGSFLVGKKKEVVDGYVDRETISRIHSRILLKEGHLYISDANSTNGTFVNGEQLPPGADIEIYPGDRILFADVGYECYNSL